MGRSLGFTRLMPGREGVRVVVNLVGDPVHGRLAESRWIDQTYLNGGQRTLYEIAFAAATCGYDTELRGWLHRPTFDRLARRAGRSPRVELPPRVPEAHDLVILPAGWRDPLDYLRMLLSPARLALAVLAGTGLFDWPFCGPGWLVPDPLTVNLEALGRPEHYAAMAALGFALLTNSPRMVDEARATGVRCTYVGTARPVPDWIRSDHKDVDVAALMDNRWAPLAEQVLSDLDDSCTIDRIERVPNDELLARLGRARLLAWPSRIEGQASIAWEARSLGCVPVALNTNRYAVGLSDECGALLVDSVPALAPAIEALLADPDRVAELAARGRRTAPLEVDWGRFVERVDAFLASVPERSPAHDAYAGMGARLLEWERASANQAQARLQEKHSEVHLAGQQLTEAMEREQALLYEVERLRAARQGPLERLRRARPASP